MSLTRLSSMRQYTRSLFALSLSTSTLSLATLTVVNMASADGGAYRLGKDL